MSAGRESGDRRGPVIVGLDYATADDAIALARGLDPRRCRVKVGKELFVRAGPPVIEALHGLGFEVFLDLKFHDIPNTVAGACRAARELGVWMVNVHAAGGRAMLEAAREALGEGRDRPLGIAVTVLTSLGDEELAEVGIAGGADAAATRLARLAERCGMDGVVCAAADLATLGAAVAPSFLKVTPGIRPAGSRADDQRRVATPSGALAAGATHLVIGRPITAAQDPAAALAAIEGELEGT